jgi:signal peptidase
VTSGSAYADAWRRPHDAPAPVAKTGQRSPTRRLVRLVLFLGVGFSLGIAALLTVPGAFGLHPFTVLSGSMEPTIHTGDIVVVDKISPLDTRVGDVVTFRSPEDPAKLITHRMISMRVRGETVFVVTRGDANTGVERWSVPTNGTIGRAEYRIPKLGYAANRVGSRFGRLAFLVVPALLLALVELCRIWRPAPTRGPGDEHRS